MAFLDRDGRIADRRYDKIRLFWFGERLPLADTFPSLRRWLPRAGDFAPGRDPGIRQLSGIRIGPQICYEGLFPDHSRELAMRGAQIFINVTNDSWFGTAAEPFQHLYMTMARGIEFRLPILRATNTGITAAMRADGAFLDVSPLRAEWVRLYEIPFRKEPEPTFYQVFGYRLVSVFPWLATAIILVAAGRKAAAPPRKDP
jgi:apolipoprotein N-acyltransferase